jgi:hypothetical protein
MPRQDADLCCLLNAVTHALDQFGGHGLIGRIVDECKPDPAGSGSRRRSTLANSPLAPTIFLWTKLTSAARVIVSYMARSAV